MDRFIDGIHIHFDGREDNLKSNMDRFIDILKSLNIVIYLFKIQYG